MIWLETYLLKHSTEAKKKFKKANSTKFHRESRESSRFTKFKSKLHF
ncbi:MAG: hypothetical protein IPQ05_20435 [Leptospiraceae bacterium]|nr:hypothetical protein [Leptospiraceae bacterium]MBK9498673.1 hypothetical protein [Leptospiraceae bacterium]MBL0266165.1 hypothetical protein [Leptospiraceae bacterium]